MPDPAHVRVWLDQSGVHRTEAAFIDFIDGKVKLLKTNGAKIDVPIAALSPADQAVAYKLKGLTPPAALVADVSGPATEPPLDAPTTVGIDQ
ncbi:hypothetical protein AMAG_01714 [Allomyces macrogynus ATCC 38327]|uniref:SLA1 homology domain-containing protein n=1 Tax=Allomyces macrogynus (strain ATCC 38327) TaxID=578462 RepID=A0A0L0S097_ALLM3|nr:hypothetical protein AMAG_01714 [Allomyces macrogynus ATCC 38327]|eukprot:KNE55845.1 hypothetical protein AMAG_01714 [Allomyces macrogynus ATCC 38327]